MRGSNERRRQTTDRRSSISGALSGLGVLLMDTSLRTLGVEHPNHYGIPHPADVYCNIVILHCSDPPLVSLTDLRGAHYGLRTVGAPGHHELHGSVT